MARNSLKNVCRLIQVAQETIPVEQEFLSDLKRSIELTDQKNTRKPSKCYKPSSMNCIRNMYYQVTGTDQDAAESNYTLVGICNSGTDIHMRVQQSVIDMASNGIDCEYVNVADYVRSRELDYLTIVKEPDPANGDYETKLYHKDLNMSFLCDGIIRYKGKYYILELKTENSYKALNRKDVDPKHYNQGTAYSIAFNIPDVIFVYINRDVLDMRSFKFTPTQEQKESLTNKIITCDEYVRTNSIPPKPENAGAKLCSYCSYKDTCRRDG